MIILPQKISYLLFLLQFKLAMCALAVRRVYPGPLQIPPINLTPIIVQHLTLTIPREIAFNKTDQPMVRVQVPPHIKSAIMVLPEPPNVTGNELQIHFHIILIPVVFGPAGPFW
jgi:hypothetical protein